MSCYYCNLIINKQDYVPLLDDNTKKYTDEKETL